ncbi:bifunctional 2-keto-4-hydroxyglutarate aldolase/2-keto-3-deoxy-6-phosphogluconate aldolase [Haloplasma contractile]|uniref:4-hydroxy-2-oxoglutarate aldolase protein n=1 Tax=Haloplasma contractile SSD-17B TaxID=1033810 RepID=F7PVA0_9MOLU|nr:bifunctional 2-keto-4-hydroxyglutarate aldolase/2-keto-3-deoxy-6-phosphogluconate aldolase [Haloplasma contractile]ERJ12935.1 4-hydroxy-2-oxoglutarate aldolase protein [Haloplasma contractile SSD-17B]
MSKYTRLKQIEEVGIVAVVRAESSEQAERISRACITGGVNVVEVTFTVPGAQHVIQSLHQSFHEDELLIGAGTVLDKETARVAILNGAKFIVSPVFDEAVLSLCNSYQVPYLPGCMTITEIFTAMKAGADIIKLFPGSACGPDYIKAIKGPLPKAVIMPTGGVNLENVHQWIKNGSVAVGVGSQLTYPANEGNYDKITVIAKEFKRKIKQAREEMERLS